MGLIVRANRNLVPSGFGLGPKRLFVLVSFLLFFLSFRFIFFLFRSLLPFLLSYFSGVRTEAP